MENIKIRLASIEDAEQLCDIYKHYVDFTIVSFEYSSPCIEEMQNRILSICKQYPWIVAEKKGKIIGYAYASKYKEREAYNWACESSVYIKKEYQDGGLGKKLYSELFKILKGQGYIVVLACISLPNEQSINFHKKMGFTEIGIKKKVGVKFDKLIDVIWLQLQLNQEIQRIIPINKMVIKF
jgi:L-amino acid N-acyltransferase YncA